MQSCRGRRGNEAGKGRRSFTGTLDEAIVLPVCSGSGEMANSTAESTERDGSSCPPCACVGVPGHLQGWGWAAFPQPGCRNCSSPDPSRAIPAARECSRMFHTAECGVSHVQMHRKVVMALVFFSRGKFGPCFWNNVTWGVGLCVTGAKYSP